MVEGRNRAGSSNWSLGGPFYVWGNNLTWHCPGQANQKASMRSMLSLGGSGYMLPQEIFLKLHALEIKFEGIFKNSKYRFATLSIHIASCEL